MKKKTGPKPLPPDEKLSERITVWLPQGGRAEYQQCADLDGHRLPSEWVRRTMAKRIKQLKRKH